MTGATIQTLISMIFYMSVVIAIGIMFAKRANKSSEDYFLGGRSLGPWVTAMSAEASDMSGWLLMGLPGVAYWCGLADAAWTAIGLALGTYVNWLITAKRLRRYSVRTNSITLPDFFSNRFREKSKVIMTISSLFILIFFTVYAASCFVTCGKLFSTLFGAPYIAMMLLGAAFVLLYTILGGFLAESASDFMQAIVMIVALVVIVVLGTVVAGGPAAIFNNAKSIPGFLDFFGIATPITDANDIQLVKDGLPQFGAAATYGFLTICSTLAWGLGYFGMPQVLLRFMAIRREKELKTSRRIATVWVVISLTVAVLIGIMGRYLYATDLLTKSDAENVFILLSQNLLSSIPMGPFIAGLIMAGILAATISSSDSYLLIAASAFAKNIYQGIFKKNASDKRIMWVSRITLLAIAVVAALIALDEDSIIFELVSFAWAGFGATFGPLVIFSLFWKRTTRAGAIAGMLSGGSMVFIWEFGFTRLGNYLASLGHTTIGGILGLYELLPAFLFSCLCIVVVSLLTKAPSKEIQDDFDAVKNGTADVIA